MKKLLLLLLAGVFLFGAEYGKITGRVTDSETGEPLIGANVIVEGTDLGAATDEKGDFTVMYIPAGTYTVNASYLGYDPMTYTNVVVNSDQTTLLNFRLNPTVIEVKGVTAVAVREPIVISQTQTGHAVTSQEMNRLPVTSINQVITLQAGVTQSGLGTHIRGGRNEEITYFVDGIVTKVPQTGGQSARINASAVEEVSIVSGGFDAEYGDALSGIINIVTKEGSNKVTGRVNYLTDDVLANKKIDYGYNLYELSFGGPVPAATRLRYFLSGEFMETDAFYDYYYKVPAPRQDYKGQARLSYSFPNAKAKITFSGFKSREQFMAYQTGWGSLKYFANRPMSRAKNWIGSSTINFQPTAQTMLTVKVGMTHYDRLFGTRDRAYEDSTDANFLSDYRLKAEHLIKYLQDNSLPPKEVIIDSVMAYHQEYTNADRDALRNNPYGIEGLYYTWGDYRVWRFWSNDDIQARFDISHFVGKVHEFKTGFDFIRYDMAYYDNNLPWVKNPFFDYYKRQPFKLAGYLQDKMDFEGLIARIGLRFDYFDPKTFTWATPNNFQDSALVEAKANYKFSPRIGISLPVTERMKFRFNYGHFYQNPMLDDMYGTSDTAVIRVALTRGNTIVGNIMLKPEKTVQYEFGMEDQLAEQYIFGFTSYFKDIYDLSQIRNVIALPMSYFQSFNVDYGNVKGFEFSLKKIMANDIWAFSVNYTLQFAKGTASSAGQFYTDFYNSGTDPITGLPLQPPQIDYWLDFDERSSVNADFSLDFPKEFVFIPLQNLSSTFVFSYHAGHPYTPMDLKGNKLGDDNSARMPGYWNIDFSAQRRIPIGPVSFALNVLINNLLNTQQITSVYETTGKPDSHGDTEPSIGQFGNLAISSTRYSPQCDFDHDGLISNVEMKKSYIAARNDYYDDPSFYNGPFRIQVGVNLGF